MTITKWKCIESCDGGCIITNNFNEDDGGWKKDDLDGQLCRCSTWEKIEDSKEKNNDNKM